MDLKSLSLISSRKALLSSKILKEELNKLPDELILELLKLPHEFEPLTETFQKTKFYYDPEREGNELNLELILNNSRQAPSLPFIEVEFTLHIVDAYDWLHFRYERKEDGSVDLSSIKQSFNPRYDGWYFCIEKIYDPEISNTQTIDWIVKETEDL